MNTESLLQQQQHAAERVRTMRQTAERYVPSRDEPSAPPVSPGKTEEKPVAPSSAPSVSSAPIPPLLPAGRGRELWRLLNWEGLTDSADRALIAAIMLLLLSESDDELLVLALLYVML